MLNYNIAVNQLSLSEFRPVNPRVYINEKHATYWNEFIYSSPDPNPILLRRKMTTCLVWTKLRFTSQTM